MKSGVPKNGPGIALAVGALALVGCGSIEYGDDAPRRHHRAQSAPVRVQSPPPRAQAQAPRPQATAGGATYVIRAEDAPAPPADGHVIVVVPGPERAVPQPSPVRVEAAPVQVEAAPAANGVIVCSGDQHLRIEGRVLDGGDDGPAIVASGNCVVEVSESVLRGQPAVQVHGNARVSLVECRVRGDLVSGGGARIMTRGTAHRGRTLHRAF
ncbi:MAG TPA: hypothetical protein RMH99_12395 [Sandaracinaceae bacterium LLY-WYZ-13_1]|nr:hypothetical protein [Sandaracinaceae bacterium LLY-WYZ-13_1]